MSNGLAIAAATSTLRYVLDRALQHSHPGPVGDARVTTLRPDRLSSPDLVQAKGINIFLHLVTPNHASTHTDLPTRRDIGSFLHRPVSALDLRYLITCYGEDVSLDGQRLLGRAVTALSVNPVFTRDIVAAAMDAYDDADETAFLAHADLADQIESIKLSPDALSLEEMSKLWALFPQTPYQLSVTYTATVVLLEAEIAPKIPLPVRQRHIAVSSAGSPRLASVETAVQGEAVVASSTLTLRGTRLLGPTTQIRIGPVRLDPAAGGTPSLVRTAIDQTVPAGLHAVQVLHLSHPGPPGRPPARVVASSNALPVVVRPTVTRITVGATDITVGLSPPLCAGQRATVSLARIAEGKAADADTLYFALPSVPADAPPQPSVAVPRRDVPDGQWLLRVQVDGVESLPERVGETYRAPSITLPPP